MTRFSHIVLPYSEQRRFIILTSAPTLLLAMGFMTTLAAENNIPLGNAAILAAFNLDPALDCVDFSWTERSPVTGEILQGYRVCIDGHSNLEERYLDSMGTPLTQAELDALGIAPKTWGSGSIAAPAEYYLPPVQKTAPALSATPVTATQGAGPSAVIDIPPIDVLKAMAEDATGESTAAKGVARTGLITPCSTPIRLTESSASEGAWETLPDGSRAWAVILYAPGMAGIRVHIAALALPEEARVMVYNVSNPAEVYGPLTAMPAGETGVWTPTCFSDMVAIECWQPQTTLNHPLTLTIDQVVQQYRSYEEFSPEKAAGACNLNAACYADWNDYTLAIGGIGTIGTLGSLWCTGSLISDSDSTTTVPYFWTANHCIDSQDEASDIEVYWFYQCSSCDGTVPPVSSVPRTTGGADYLAGSSRQSAGTDFTLLRLRQSPPSGVVFLGWTTTYPATNTQATCLHHPKGEYLRISFGTLRDLADSCWTSNPGTAKFHRVTWDQGTTEPGSSGSPLMLQTTGQLIGQLYGGYATCALAECPDYYGRFDQTYPLVQAWLGQAADPADIDKSGTVNSVDLQIVVNAALGYPVSYDADIDKSGLVDALDVQKLVIAILKKV